MTKLLNFTLAESFIAIGTHRPFLGTISWINDRHVRVTCAAHGQGADSFSVRNVFTSLGVVPLAVSRDEHSGWQARDDVQLRMDWGLHWRLNNRPLNHGWRRRCFGVRG